MKTDFKIYRVTKREVKELFYNYHYLKDESKDFKSGFNYGLYKKSSIGDIKIGKCLASCIFTGLPVPEIAVGAFGLDRNNQEGIYELSRLCVHPDIQSQEHNITSWFVSRCIKQFKKDTQVKAILSYADSAHHEGTIYKACNFDYYGLSDPKNDFWIKQTDGTYIKHSRGSLKGLDGEWRPRTRKHRFLMVFDKSLNVLWEKIE